MQRVTVTIGHATAATAYLYLSCEPFTYANRKILESAIEELEDKRHPSQATVTISEKTARAAYNFLSEEPLNGVNKQEIELALGELLAELNKCHQAWLGAKFGTQTGSES